MRKLIKSILPEVGVGDLKIRPRGDNRCESAKSANFNRLAGPGHSTHFVSPADVNINQISIEIQKYWSGGHVDEAVREVCCLVKDASRGVWWGNLAEN